MTPPVIRLQQVANAKARLQCQLGPAGIQVAEGYGGWRVVSRPRGVGITEWDGPGPQKATLQLLFDGWLRGKNGIQVTGPLVQLQRWFAPPPNATREPPPFFVVGAWPVRSSMHWVCDGLNFEDEGRILRRSDRAPVRTLVTLNLLQYVPGDVVVKGTAAKRSGGAKTSAGKTKTYVVRSGDTLSAIAARVLGDHRKAASLAKLNGIRDGNRLKVGQTLRLPS